MELESKYLTYDEYVGFSNSKIDKISYVLFEYDVRKLLNERTQGRLTKLIKIPEEVKICTLKMIQIFEKYKPLEDQNKVISSEGTDGYSISYKKLEKSDIDAKNKELEGVMRRYLSDVVVDGTPVLWAGVDNAS